MATPQASILALLRGDRHRRPLVDRELIVRLRARVDEDIERSIASLEASGPGCRKDEGLVDPLYVTRRLINYELGVFPGASGDVDGRGTTGGFELNVAVARNALVGALFREVVMGFEVGVAIRDAMSVLEAEGCNDDVLEYVKGLPREEKIALAREVGSHASGIVGRWPAIPSNWLPRTHDRIVVPVASGRVVFGALVDLIIGSAPTARSSTCLVTVKLGEPRVEDREDAHVCALLETLRSGAPPFRVATYYTRNGQLDVDDVTPDSLEATLTRVVRATRFALRRRIVEAGRN
ncbi:MAG: hypothetical protein M1134_01085 [Actinobacteria bacterium]|nr:hypothetical protein [Actinomycetota bacterium]MCL5445380.1 hypothetical protein [Actinomycetota bacterium]